VSLTMTRFVYFELVNGTVRCGWVLMGVVCCVFRARGIRNFSSLQQRIDEQIVGDCSISLTVW
jgi:hypothetical protein